MFVALKNWRERLRHQGGDCSERLLATAERVLEADGAGSAELLRHFRAAALVPGEEPSLAQLGPQFGGAEPLSTGENLSIMASIERGAAQARRHR
jgi:hypothetical protein